MKIAIIDADLIGRTRHRFPNLACEKLSGYWKEKGAEVKLETSYDNLDKYDKVFICKVFTDTPVPDLILKKPNVEYGGTGFFFDKAPNLPYEIEHHFPDYHLYDDFISDEIKKGIKASEFKEYTDCSIGFLTRGCFRKCSFCVNQKYDHVFKHSNLNEFYDPSRPSICLLDDQFFGCSEWKNLFEELIATGKKFKFKQGLDERLLTDEKCELLCRAKYDGAITFAFDNVEDYALIEKKLQMIRRHSHKQFTFYVLVGFDRSGKWDYEFWKNDVRDAFIRIKLLMKYNCVPYIMRFNRYNESPFREVYVTLARWCNQTQFFKKMSFREFCEANQSYKKNQKIPCAALRSMKNFESSAPEIAAEYFDMRWSEC